MFYSLKIKKKALSITDIHMSGDVCLYIQRKRTSIKGTGMKTAELSQSGIKSN